MQYMKVYNEQKSLFITKNIQNISFTSTCVEMEECSISISCQRNFFEKGLDNFYCMD